MHLPPNVTIKNGRAYHVKRIDGKPKWTGLARLTDGESAIWSAWQRLGTDVRTVGDLLAAYSKAADGLLKKRPKTQIEYLGAIERHLTAAFGTARIADVTQRRVAMFLDERGNVAANRAVATLSAAYSWGMRKGLAETNPCRGVARNTERPRTRYVTHAELQAALDKAPPAFGQLLSAAYLTGLRQSDLRGLERGALRDEGLLVQEEKRGKRIMLGWSRALRVLTADALVNAAPGVEHLFTNERGQPWTVRAIQSAMGRLKLSWTFHDLRAKAESDSATGLGLLTRYKRARRVQALDGMIEG